MLRVPPLVAALWLPVQAIGAGDAPHNGFDLRDSSVPIAEILAGGPARGGIPALLDPKVVAAADSPWGDDQMVIGVVRGGAARAYPIGILNWHELVNDELGASPILVSYCPLCGTGMVFEREIAGASRTFGVSGLLYRSDVLFYDRETESLWSQIESKAITGPERGKRLKLIRSAQLSWGEWRRRHPDSSVLSDQTGYERDYLRSPYGDYARSDRLMFQMRVDPRYMSKMPTIGLRTTSGAARAYPAVEVLRAGGSVEESFEGRKIRVAYDEPGQVFSVEAPSDIEVVEGFWFAWMVFHPNSSVFVSR